MDLTVYEFLELHAKSRMVENEEEVIRRIFEKANELAGEKFKNRYSNYKFKWWTIKSAYDSRYSNIKYSPIVLIDEIENAGIDRKKL